jgi:hypothetical protein
MTTFGLGFNALPNVFAQMVGGRFFGTIWFFMLFLAAITSSISMLQPVIAFLEEGLGLKRHASAAMLGLITALGTGFVLYFSKDSVAMDTLDNWVGTLLIFMLAMFQSVLYGWIFGIKRGDEELHKGAHIRVPWFIQLVLKYVAPAYLIIIFATFCWKNLPSHTEPTVVADAVVVADLKAGTVPSALGTGLQDAGIKLPAGAVVTSQGEAGPWLLGKPDDAPVAVVSTFKHVSGSDVVMIHKYTAGWIESMWRKPVAFMAMCLIAIVLVFLLLLINIAGKRWVKDGRLAPAD